jgi:hypothetical protein
MIIPTAVKRTMLSMLLFVAVVALPAAERPPNVLITGGTYINGYPPVYQSFGCRTELADQEAFARTDLAPYDLVHVDNWKPLPKNVQDKLYEYTRNGGAVIFSLGSIPDQRFFNAAQMPQTAEGYGGDIVPAPGSENVFRTVKGPCGYTSWAGIIYAAHLPSVTVLANWTMPQNRSKEKMMIDAFKTTAPAIIKMKVGKGVAFYAGALLTKPTCHGLLRGLVNTLFPQTDVLAELEAEMETEVAVANKTDLLKSDVVAVFREKDFPRAGLPDDVTPEFIAAALNKNGIKTAFIDVEGLQTGLTVDKYNTLVLASGETFPLAAYGELKAFAAAGGGIVSPAGLPLSRPMKLENGVYREIADGARTEQVATLIADKLLPIGKYFYEQTPSTSCAILAPELLPGLPTIIPGRGKVGLQLITAGSYRAQAPVVAAFNPAGEVESVPFAFTFYQNRFPAARYVLATFAAEDHPWSPSSWNRAEELIAAMVKLAMRRDYVALTELYVDKVSAQPGETVVIHGAARGMRTLEFQVKVSVYPYRADLPVLETAVPVKMLTPGVGRFQVDFKLPDDAENDRFDVIAEIIHPKGAPVNVQRALIVVDGGRPKNRAEVGFEDGHFTLNGRPTRLNGVNLYVNEGRAPGAFFIDASNPQKLADVWERDLDLVQLTGGNAARQQYFEKLLDERSFDSDNLQIRALDAYLRLHDLTGTVAVIDPLTFAPINYDLWKKRFPDAVKKPYTAADATAAVMAYLGKFGARYAGYRNIVWEVINEPELHTPTLGTDLTEKDLRDWFAKASDALRAADPGKKVGIGNTHNYDSVQFNLRENLKGLALWSHIHPYYQDALELRCLKSTPFGLNFGRPCLIGEMGMPNPHTNPAAKLGDWRLYYENTFAALIAEQGAGFLNFYLSNSLNTGAPEWGMLRGDLTEKASFKRWKLWTELSRLLPPNLYVTEKNLIAYFVSDRRDGRNSYSNALAATYLGLVNRGANAKLLSTDELDGVAAGFVWIAATPKTAVRAAELAAKLKKRGIASETVMVGEAAKVIPATPGYTLPTGSFTLSYAVGKKDGSYTFVFIGAQGSRAKLVFQKTFEFTPSPGSSVIIDTLPDGSPRLVQLTGEISVDGKLLAASAQPFILAAPEGESLLQTSRANLYADAQSQVKLAVTPADAIAPAATFALPKTIDAELRAAFERAGGRTAPAGEADYEVVFDAAPITRGGRWPEIRIGDRRLERPWSASIEFAGREVRISAPTPAAKLAALLRLADLRQTGSYSVGPFYRQD